MEHETDLLNEFERDAFERAEHELMVATREWIRWVDLIEKRRADRAGRRADAAIAAGDNPF